MTLVTNRRDWAAVKIVSTYLLRSGVDAFYRDDQQHLGSEDYQLFLAHSFFIAEWPGQQIGKKAKIQSWYDWPK